jgi:hypothetical protein
MHKQNVLNLLMGDILKEAWKNIPQEPAVPLSC